MVDSKENDKFDLGVKGLRGSGAGAAKAQGWAKGRKR